MSLRSQEPRSVTIIRHVNDYLLSTSTKHASFADDVVRIYHERVPNRRARIIQFHADGDPSKDLRANEQLVMRIVTRSVKFPCDLEEAFVFALPEQWRADCLRDLSGRYDLLAAKVPLHDGNDDAGNLQRMLKETGDIVLALSPIFADGRVDARDAEFAQEALLQIDEALAELVSMRVRLSSILPERSGNVVSIL